MNSEVIYGVCDYVDLQHLVYDTDQAHVCTMNALFSVDQYYRTLQEV